MSIVGLWLITAKNRWGFGVGVVKEIVFVAYALASRQYGFAVGEAVFLVLFIRGFVLWSQPNSKPKKNTAKEAVPME